MSNKLINAQAALKEQKRILDQIPMNQEPETWTFEDEMNAQRNEQARLEKITRKVGRNWKKKARTKKARRNWKQVSRKARKKVYRENIPEAQGFTFLERTNSMPESGLLDHVDRVLRSGIRDSVRSVKSLFGKGKKKRKSNKKNKNKKNTMKRNKKNKKNRKK